MPKKKLTRIAKLEFMAGEARPGPALAGLGIDMGGFTRDYNEASKKDKGKVIPAIIKCYSDRSYEFTLKTTPVAHCILEKINLEKGAGNSTEKAISQISKKEAMQIAKYKMKDLNTNDLEKAIKIIVGTAHNMGVAVEGYKRKEKSLKDQKIIINTEYEKQIAQMEAGIAQLNEETTLKKEQESKKVDDKNA